MIDRYTTGLSISRKEKGHLKKYLLTSEMFLYWSSYSSFMRLLIMSLFLVALLVIACGGTITGSAVDDTADEPTAEDDNDDEHIIVEGPTEEEKKFAEEYAGKDCEEDSLGVVRVYEDGKKTVYKNDCFGNILVDYYCEDGKLENDNVKCPSSCQKDRYGKGYCE